MTEAEAKSKWCPFSRSIYFVNAPSVAGTFVAANRGNDGKFPAKNCCLGSGCMAWTGKSCLMMRQSVSRTWGKESLEDDGNA
jgi:hypothetical protein